jgi:hypothetical protein
MWGKDLKALEKRWKSAGKALEMLELQTPALLQRFSSASPALSQFPALVDDSYLHQLTSPPSCSGDFHSRYNS